MISGIQASHCKMFIIIFLVCSVMLVYWKIQDYDFVNFDDNLYVTDNPHVKMGITPENITWAFSAIEAGF